MPIRPNLKIQVLLDCQVATALTEVIVRGAEAHGIAWNTEIVFQVKSLQALNTHSIVVIPSEAVIGGSGLASAAVRQPCHD